MTRSPAAGLVLSGCRPSCFTLLSVEEKIYNFPFLIANKADKNFSLTGLYMTISTGFLIYAALYRLTVLAVGALSIWLGFRLFSTAGSKKAEGSASAEADGVKLTFTNLLPGTYFALFGTTLISVMLWKHGPPQLDQKSVTEKTDKGELRSASNLMRREEFNLDGPAANEEKSGITEAGAAEMMEAIAKLLRKNGNEDGAARIEQAAESLRRNGQ